MITKYVINIAMINLSNGDDSVIAECIYSCNCRIIAIHVTHVDYQLRNAIFIDIVYKKSHVEILGIEQIVIPSSATQ